MRSAPVRARPGRPPLLVSMTTKRRLVRDARQPLAFGCAATVRSPIATVVGNSSSGSRQTPSSRSIFHSTSAPYRSAASTTSPTRRGNAPGSGFDSRRHSKGERATEPDLHSQPEVRLALPARCERVPHVRVLWFAAESLRVQLLGCRDDSVKRWCESGMRGHGHARDVRPADHHRAVPRAVATRRRISVDAHTPVTDSERRAQSSRWVSHSRSATTCCSPISSTPTSRGNDAARAACPPRPIPWAVRPRN